MHKYFLSGLVVVYTMATGKPVLAASFDCSKSKSILEVLICADTNLSRLDGEMGELFNAYYQSSKTQSEKQQRLDAQRKFLKERTETCPIPYQSNLSEKDSSEIISCLKETYIMRVAGLNHIMNREGNTAASIKAPARIEVEDNHVTNHNEGVESSDEADCRESVLARPYFISACVVSAFQEVGQNPRDAIDEMKQEQEKLKCSSESLRRLQRDARIAANEAIRSGAISELMDFNSAAQTECRKAASIVIP